LRPGVWGRAGWAALWTLFSLGAAGCAGLQLDSGERAPTRELTAETLASKVWTSRPGVRYLRQAALFEFHEVKVAADGLLRLDPASGSARLVALNEMGVKLFDVTVTRGSLTENFLLPELAKAKGLSASLAACLRAVFLDYEPRPADKLTTRAETYELSRTESGGRLTSTFSGFETLLLKEYSGADQSWTVRFSDYRRAEDLWVPGHTVFTDRRAGYRVSLWLKEVKSAHE
jgi:hypothetical protein